MVSNTCRGTVSKLKDIFQYFTSFLAQMVYMVVRAHEMKDYGF